MLELFFQIHDPTTLDRQGNDIGTQYRSAIFYLDDTQKAVAEDTIQDVDASGLWPGRVVTEVTPAGEFWDAEDFHQDYLARYPNGYTCRFPRPDWVLPKRNAGAAYARTPIRLMKPRLLEAGFCLAACRLSPEEQYDRALKE